MPAFNVPGEPGQNRSQNQAGAMGQLPPVPPVFPPPPPVPPEPPPDGGCPGLLNPPPPLGMDWYWAWERVSATLGVVTALMVKPKMTKPAMARSKAIMICLVWSFGGGADLATDLAFLAGFFAGIVTPIDLICLITIIVAKNRLVV
jgi:hypothetical protein